MRNADPSDCRVEASGNQGRFGSDLVRQTRTSGLACDLDDDQTQRLISGLTWPLPKPRRVGFGSRSGSAQTEVSALRQACFPPKASNLGLRLLWLPRLRTWQSGWHRLAASNRQHLSFSAHLLRPRALFPPPRTIPHHHASSSHPCPHISCSTLTPSHFKLCIVKTTSRYAERRIRLVALPLHHVALLLGLSHSRRAYTLTALPLGTDLLSQHKTEHGLSDRHVVSNLEVKARLTW